MAGFRKAKAEQAALKMGMYGPPGSGKTFTSLLVAEGLAKLEKKRIAFVDTEHGSDFYCKTVPTRTVHPEAFDFDALYSRSITEVVKEVRSLKESDYGVVVLDSMTHLWQACMESYQGKRTKVGTIPVNAWGRIKKPYKDLMTFLLNSPMHVIICGRQGTEYETDEETDEMRAVGVKMKAEGETPYEPHILIRMEGLKPKKSNELATIVAYAEKDRTGVLAGRSFVNPTFETLCKPLLSLLGGKQAQLQTLDEAAVKDADELAAQETERLARSTDTLREWVAKVNLARTAKDLKAIGRQITPKLKAQMTPQDVQELREAYQTRERDLPSAAGPPADDESPEDSAPPAPSEPGSAPAADPPPGTEQDPFAVASALVADGNNKGWLTVKSAREWQTWLQQHKTQPPALQGGIARLREMQADFETKTAAVLL